MPVILRGQVVNFVICYHVLVVTVDMDILDVWRMLRKFWLNSKFINQV